MQIAPTFVPLAIDSSDGAVSNRDHIAESPREPWIEGGLEGASVGPIAVAGTGPDEGACCDNGQFDGP